MKMKKYAFYLGCITPLRYPGIESSTREVLNHLGIECMDLEGATCCPAPGVTRSFDIKTWLSLASRNLALAEEREADIVTICNGCFGTLSDASFILQDEKKREEINEITKRKYNGGVRVRHFAELIYKEIGIAKIKEKVEKPQQMDVAVHYGCHFLKPSSLRKTDNPERPRMLDELVEAAGAKSIAYRDKLLCCGAGGGVRARTPDVALKITRLKLENIGKSGASCIVNPCPFCHLQFDRGQVELKLEQRIPVLHISQLLALSFGVERAKLGFDQHAVPVNL
jgi:heterodisulfide reductase subunit B